MADDLSFCEHDALCMEPATASTLPWLGFIPITGPRAVTLNQGSSTALGFLQPSTLDDFSEATLAHGQARKTLAEHLHCDEIAAIEAVRDVSELHSIACKAQDLSRSRSRWSRGQSVLLTLDRYKGVLDVIAQAHAEYTCLAWGAMKWILTVAVNYVKLLQRIATMLEDIGYRLPRIQLYQHLLPNKRMACVISELYAAMIGFFTQAILFFNKSRTRKLFSFLHGPLEAEFRTALERVQRLSGLVEEDARAAAMASQHAANLAMDVQLQEVRLVTRHAMQSVLEVKQLQAQYLLEGVRSDLFRGHCEDLIFQYDMMRLWTNLVAPVWSSWFREEMSHVPVYQNKHADFAYVQTESMQFLITLNIISQNMWIPDRAAQTSLCWSRRMTVETALASLIYRYLEQYPERLLYRHSPGYYADKLRNGSQTGDSLLELYLEIVTALPGSKSMIAVDSDSAEAAIFVRLMIDLRDHLPSKQHSMIIYHITDPALSKGPRVVELDNEYDVAPELDTSETMFRVAMMSLGIFGTLSEDVQNCLWSGLWRALRYSLIVFVFNSVIVSFKACVQFATIEDVGQDQQKVAEASLKRKIIAFFQGVERDIPLTSRSYLTSLLEDATNHKAFDACIHAQPLQPDEQLAIWTTTENMFSSLVKEHFTCLVEDELSVMIATDERGSNSLDVMGALKAIESIFSLSEWDKGCLENVQQAIRAALEQAAAAGLLQIVKMYVER